MKLKRLLLTFLGLAASVGVLASCAHEHTFATEWTANETHHWHEATCKHAEEVADKAEHEWGTGEVTKAATCTEKGVKTYTCVCGETKTEEISVIAHTWVDADCENAKHCSVCEETEGEALGHTWVDADCENTKKCSVCNKTEGEALGHTWVDADCENAKHCSVCEKTEGEALGHTWVDADCENAKHCSVCEKTEGEALGHTWVDADCENAKHCSVCEKTEGEALGHDEETIPGYAATCTEVGLSDGKKCTVCDKITVTQQEIAAKGHKNNSIIAEVVEDVEGYYLVCATCEVKTQVTPITITEALAIGGEKTHDTYTTEKYVIVGTVKNVYNTTYGNMYVKDASGKEICVYGLYNNTGKTRYDAMSYKPVAGDTVVIYGVLGKYNTTIQFKNAWLVKCDPHTHDYTEATCTTPKTCTICAATEGEVLPHTDEDKNHSCDVCEAMTGAHEDTNGDSLCEYCGEEISSEGPVVGTLAEFTFGANGSAAHVDGQGLGASKSYTANGYTLALTGMEKVYGTAYDAKGNSCIKLGTGSAVGKFSFTVPENVTEVIILVAKYKANTTKISVNGTAYTVTTASNNGAYTEIKVDTTTTKTVSFTTVSGGVRCMINGIIFNGYSI
jgi:hypothetical protein